MLLNWVKGNSYDLNSSQALADFSAGAIEGALNVAGGPLMDKFSKLSVVQRAAVMSTILKNPVITKALSKGTIEGVTSFVENKTVQEIVKEAISGAISSGAQGGVTSAMDESTWSDGIGEGFLKVGESGLAQAETGLVTSAVMTTAFKAGGYVMGKIKPKADTPDGLEVKLKDPEKFSKAHEILSEGSHSEAELTEKFKKAGFKDEEIKSVLEHKSSAKAGKTSVSDLDDTGNVSSEGINSNETLQQQSSSYKPGKTSGDGKKMDNMIDAIKDRYGGVKLSEHEIGNLLERYNGLNKDLLKNKIITLNELENMLNKCSLRNMDNAKLKKEIMFSLNAIRLAKFAADVPVKAGNVKFGDFNLNFYGEERASEWIQEAIDLLPDGIKDKLTKPRTLIDKILVYTGFKKPESLLGDIYVNTDFTFIDDLGQLSPANKGVCKISTGEIVLNKQVLSAELMDFQKKYSNNLFFNSIKDKSLKELLDDINSIELAARKGTLQDELNLNLIKRYVDIVKETRNEWMNTFNHELFHRLDHISRINGNYLSDSAWAFRKDIANNITTYANNCKRPPETAADTFMKLMEHSRTFAEKHNGIINQKEFINYLMDKDKTYMEQYNFIIKYYLTDRSGTVNWPELPEYLMR